MTPFSMVRDINGFNGFGVSFSDQKYSMTLALGVEQTITIPKPADGQYKNWLVIFSGEPGTSVWVALNGTAVAPTGAASTTTSELNPTARKVAGDGSQVLHFITPDTSADVGVVLYAIP